MANPVLQTVAIESLHWPTLDPFLFCAHHDDHYPSGDERMAPTASLEGRQLGADFSGQDGWSMYHGEVVPGFPAHPHRGFETVTYLRAGVIDHADSIGAAARFGPGDVQWLTAGGGIVHSEMFPLLERDRPNRQHLFQIWLNLPTADKMADPYFTMLWGHDIPVVRDRDPAGREVTVIAGRLGDVAPPPPPPSSWAARAESDVAIWHLRLEPGATWTLPAARHPDTNRVLYVYEGETLHVGETKVGADTAVVLRPDLDAVLAAGPAPVEALVLAGRPIGEPVARYGPFVMNNRAEIEQAIRDYQATQYGGWPWPDPAPTHGAERRRFARHADGHVEELAAPTIPGP